MAEKRKERSESPSSPVASAKKQKTARELQIEAAAKLGFDMTGEPLSYAEALAAVKAKRGDGPIRLYADGIYDMFHYGHARALEQAKKSFPNTYLIVGCCDDELTNKYKGKTVMADHERYEALRHCKWVDEVVTSAPWVLTREFVDKHDIDFVCHDELPYGDASGSVGDVYAHLKHVGKFHPTQRTEGVSTSDLIVRIIKDYDDFVRRNLSRGHSAEEMNVPFMKEQAIRLDMVLDKAKSGVKGVKDKVGSATKDTLAGAGSVIRRWSDKAEEMQVEFLKMFSKDGVLRSALRRTTSQVQARWKQVASPSSATSNTASPGTSPVTTARPAGN